MAGALDLNFTWMAWTGPTAVFFILIGLAIAAMALWEYVSPGGAPRRGIFRIDTTRGDRLFISLLGSAFIFLGWLAVFGSPLWGPAVIAVVWTVFVFRYA